MRHILAAIVLGVAAGCASAAQAQSSAVSSGTGFFVNADGWAVTNAHVLEGCTRATVSMVGEATDWIIDRQNDLAAVKVAKGTGKPFLQLRGTPPRLGDDIAAFGYPLHGVLSDSIKITTGNINSLVGIDNDTRYLQISAPLQPGNSGGPVVDRTGAVLGVATAVLGSSFAVNTGILPQNVNFAVRSSVLEMFLQSRGIHYQVSEAVDRSLSTADLAEGAAPSIVEILCFKDAASAAVGVASDTSPAPKAFASAIFYKERTNEAQGSAEAGSVAWSVAQESPGGGAPPEPAIRAEATVPGGDVQLRMTIRRNSDQTLPASHIIEMLFLTPPSFEGGAVINVPSIVFKETEQAVGNALIGIPAKITDNFFLIALDNGQAQEEANTALMSGNSWIDVPIVYKSGRRALITLEKGIRGNEIFAETLDAWRGKP